MKKKIVAVVAAATYRQPSDIWRFVLMLFFTSTLRPFLHYDLVSHSIVRRRTHVIAQSIASARARMRQLIPLRRSRRWNHGPAIGVGLESEPCPRRVLGPACKVHVARATGRSAPLALEQSWAYSSWAWARVRRALPAYALVLQLLLDERLGNCQGLQRSLYRSLGGPFCTTPII